MTATADLRLSSSAFSYAAQCLKRYQYRFVDRLVPKPKTLGLPLRRGIWVHSCLEALVRGEDWTTVLSELAQQAAEYEMDPNEILKLSKHVVDIIEGYIDYYDEDDAFNPLTPVLIEEEIELSINEYLTITVTPDLLARNKQGLWLIENKSTVEIPSSAWRGVDPQTAIQYVALIKEAAKRKDPSLAPVGIMFNYLLTRPAPMLKFKQKDLQPYATKIKATTPVAFERSLNYPGVREMIATVPEYSAMIAQKRAEIVHSDVFYQRFWHFRPKEHLLETFADVSHTVKNIRLAMQLKHFPRAFHPIMCSKFCTYGQLCMTEYMTGKEAQVLRRENFDLDDGTREGVTARERVLARLALESTAGVEGLDDWL